MPPNRLDRSLRATFLGMAVNAVLTALKLAAGILGHSHALLADAAESMADLFTSIIVWRAVVVSRTEISDVGQVSLLQQRHANERVAVGDGHHGPER